MFTRDKVTTFDFTGDRAPYRMSYHSGSEHVRVVVCVCVFVGFNSNYFLIKTRGED